MVVLRRDLEVHRRWKWTDLIRRRLYIMTNAT